MGFVGRTFPNSSCVERQPLSHVTHLEQPSHTPLHQEGSLGKASWKRRGRNKKVRAA